jgi:hypothetical protein
MKRMERYVGEECIRIREKKGGIYRKMGEEIEELLDGMAGI